MNKSDYDVEIKYQKKQTLYFSDFEMKYVQSKTNNFEVGGTWRSSSTQLFEIGLNNEQGDRKKITREYSYGFPGEISPGFGFLVNRRKYVAVKIYGVSEEGGFLKVNTYIFSYEPKVDPITFVIDPTEMGKDPQFIKWLSTISGE